MELDDIIAIDMEPPRPRGIPVQDAPRILVCDDDRAIRDLVAWQMRDAGYDVVLARHAAEAFDRMKEYQFSLVVMDGQMPGMDGTEAVKRIKGDRYLSQIPVLMLTARTAHDHVLAALQNGADDYMAKPVHATELLRRVQKLLAR